MPICRLSNAAEAQAKPQAEQQQQQEAGHILSSGVMTQQVEEAIQLQVQPPHAQAKLDGQHAQQPNILAVECRSAGFGSATTAAGVAVWTQFLQRFFR